MSTEISTVSSSGKRVVVHALGLCEIMKKVDTDFKERAFAPFWDGICNAATKLGCIEAEMKSIAKSYHEYMELYQEYLKIYRDGDPRPKTFSEQMLNPIDPDTMKGIMDHFHFLVRSAQKDFQFAVIYEHYRTREVLIEGFRNLSDAINYLSREVSEGFCELQICFEEEHERTRHTITRTIATIAEKNEIQQRERDERLLASYVDEWEASRKALTTGFEYSETGQQKLHDEVIVEGKRDRKLIKDIDRQVGGDEWRRS